jgi:hypothetical protein
MLLLLLLLLLAVYRDTYAKYAHIHIHTLMRLMGTDQQVTFVMPFF